MQAVLTALRGQFPTGMKISCINVYKVTLPFKFTFSHSRKDAKSVDNIVVEILTDQDELRGYGEGGPRPYVTGETQESAINGVQSLCQDKRFPWVLEDVSQVWKFVDFATGKKNLNSALCALETALLDLLGKKEGRNILHYLPKDYVTDEIRYGGTIPIADQRTVFSISSMLRKFDIRDVRLKMGRDFEQNRRALEVVRQVMDREYDLRVDVNGAWDLQAAKEHLHLLASYGVSVLEQPLMPEDPNLKELASILKAQDIKLMADESVCSLRELDKATKAGDFDMIHVRLSKCGGFASALKMIDRIRATGLSAAGRALCAVTSDALYRDGSYDSFLLRENLTTEHVSFGHGGRAAPLKSPGLGIRVDDKNLKRFSEYFIIVQKW
jgi:L-alanine-DL-glutamate epimerase-like enolase superfamily enzyme